MDQQDRACMGFVEKISKILEIGHPVTKEKIDDVYKGLGIDVVVKDEGIDFSITFNRDNTVLIEVPEEPDRIELVYYIGLIFLESGWLMKWFNKEYGKKYTYFKHVHGNRITQYRNGLFTLAFLMPESDFRRSIYKHSSNDEIDIFNVAKDFDLSYRMAYNYAVFLSITQAGRF